MNWLESALGPAGALALAVPVAAIALRKLEARWTAEVADRDARIRELVAERQRLDDRLAQAAVERVAAEQRSAESLLKVYERVHTTLDGLEPVLRESIRPTKV